MTLGPGEQIRAIIGIDYVGADDVQRYLADLQRLGGLTDQAAGRIGQAWRGAAAGTLSYGRALREITGALNQSETSIRRLERQLEGVAFGRNDAALRSYVTQLQQLDRFSRQAAGGLTALAQARQRLASVFATNLGAMAYDVRQGPVALAAARRPLELSSTGSPAPVAYTPADRRMDRVLGALEARESAGNVIAGGQPFATQRANVEFERLNPALEQTRTRLQAVNAALANVTAPGRRLSLDDSAVRAEATSRAQEINRAALTTLANQFSGTGRSDYNDALRRWAEMTPQYPHDRRLLTQGEFMPTHLKQNPDLTRGLFGAETYELRRGVGRGGAAAALPGGTNLEAQLRELQAEYDNALMRNVASRQQRMYREFQRQAQAVGALPMGTTAYASLSQMRGMWQQAFPNYGMTQLGTRTTPGNLPVPYRPSFGQADLGNIVYGGQYRYQQMQRPMTIGYNQAGYAYPGYMMPGMGTSVDARTLLAQQAQQPQVVQGTVLGSSTTRITGTGGASANEAIAMARNLLRGAGGDANIAKEGLRGLGYSAKQAQDLLSQAAQASGRVAAAEQMELRATQAQTAATQAQTAATRAAVGTLSAYRPGMGMGTPAMPAAPITTAARFTAGPGGTGQFIPAATTAQQAAAASFGAGPSVIGTNLPAVVQRTTGAMVELYTGIGPVREAYINQARVLGQQAAATAATNAAQARYRSALSSTQTSLLQSRLTRGYINAGTTMPTGGGYTPPPPLPPVAGGTAAAGGGGGFLGGAAGASFMAGFRGRGDRPYMEQLGQTFKFATFYGAAYKILFAITQTFQATLQEAIAFQTAMVDLNIATGRSSEANQELADQLGRTATEAGFQPGEGVTAGARAIGLYGLTEAPYAEQSVAARSSARVATMLALGSGRPYQDIQADLGAIAQGFGTGYAGQERVADLDAYLSRKFGITPGATLQPVAETAGVANLAGFSLEEAVAISANLQSRTGQSASTIGGLLTQIFTRSGEGSLLQVAQRYGVDTRQDLRGQLEDLGTAYRQVGPTQQAEIAASFGRGRSQNVAAVLLGDSAEIFNEAAEAAGKAAGSAEAQFNKRLENIGGQLSQLGGDFMQFAKLLGEAGLLSAIGLGVKALEGLFAVVNPVLDLFASMPGPLNEVILALGAFALAAKSGALTTGYGALASRAAGTAAPMMMPTGPLAGKMITPAVSATPGVVSQLRYLPAGPMGQMLPVPTGRIGMAVPTGRLGESAMLASRAGVGMAAVSAGEALMSLVNPVTIAIGGLMAIGAVKGSMDRVHEASKAVYQTAATLKSTMPSGGWSAADFRSQAGMYGQLAEQSRGAVGGFTNAITFGFANDPSVARADWLQDEQKFRDRFARRLEAQAEAVVPETTPIFSALDTEGISAGLDLMATSGATTQQQMNALAHALLNAGAAAEEAREKYRPGISAGELATGITDAFTGTRFPTFTKMSVPSPYPTLPEEVGGQAIKDALRGTFNSKALNEQLLSAYKTLDIGSEREEYVRAPEIAGLISQNILDQLPPGLKPRDRQRIVRMIRELVIGQIRRQRRQQAALQDPDRMLTAPEAAAGAEFFVQGAETRAGELEENDYAGRTRISRGLVQKLRGLTQRTRDPVPRVLQLLAAAERKLAEDRFNELEEARRAAQAGARNQRQIAAIGRRYMGMEIRGAVRGGSADVIKDIIDRGGKEAFEQVKSALQAALEVAKAAAQMRQRLFASLAALAKATTPQQSVLTPGQDQSPFASWLPEDLPTVENDPAVRRYNRLLDWMQGVPYSRRGKDNKFDRPDDVPGLEYTEGGAPDQHESNRLDRLAARDAAAAAARGGDVAAARADLTDAQRRLNAAKEGSLAYYQALEQYHNAERALGEAVGARSSAQRRAGIAPDDTVAAARADMQDALAAMRRAPANSAEYWDAVAQYQQAQHAYAQAQAEEASARQRAAAAPDDAVAMAKADMEQALAQMRLATPGTAAYYDAVVQYKAAQHSYAQSQVEVADAQDAAQAARDGGAIAGAKSELDAAKRALDLATPGTAAYFQALAGMYQSQQALSDAVLEYQTNLRLLGGDITNPLFEARVALRAARDKLSRDLAAGRGEDVIAQDRVDARRAQAEAEATAFSQRLERVQTAESLGRISHARYIQYLENESRRLNRIKDRTYQQQQQLNQIDQLLQEASDAMQGQFNLGDIKLPTPYQVRRYIEQRTESLLPSRRDIAGGRGAANVNSNNTTTIQIDGADTRKVRAIVNEALGSQPRRITPAPRRR